MLNPRLEEMTRRFPENGLKHLLENPFNVRDLLGIASTDVVERIDLNRLTRDDTTYVKCN